MVIGIKMLNACQSFTGYNYLSIERYHHETNHTFGF